MIHKAIVRMWWKLKTRRFGRHLPPERFDKTLHQTPPVEAALQDRLAVQAVPPVRESVRPLGERMCSLPKEGKDMSPKVKFCRNVVASMGVFTLLGAASLIIINPAKWLDGLEMLSAAFMCWTIVGQVNRREGGWHEKAFAKKPHTEAEPPSA